MGRGIRAADLQFPSIHIMIIFPSRWKQLQCPDTFRYFRAIGPRQRRVEEERSTRQDLGC